MARALRSGASSQPSKRPSDNTDNREQRMKQKQDKPAADTGKAKAKQAAHSKKTSQPGIVIRENHGAQPSKQKKSSKIGKETEKRKEKQPVVHESGSESESDPKDEEQAGMSEEDEGEPIEEQDWVGTFMSPKARRAYDKIVTSKTYIPEKPLHISALSRKQPSFLLTLHNKQQWRPILKGFGYANLTWVRELYAKWRHTDGNVIRVRGVDVDINAQALNNFLQVPHVSMQRYNEFVENPDFSHLNSIVCPNRDDAHWKSGTTEYHSLAKEYMCALARVVLNWVCNRLMPCLHKTNVLRERVFLIYALMVDMELNLGEIMLEQMQRTRRNFKWCLLYANTLPAYMRHLGVPERLGDDKELAPKAYHITAVHESTKVRTSQFTTSQWFQQIHTEHQEIKAEQARQAEQLNNMQAAQAQNTVLMRLLCQHFNIDTAAALSTPSTAGPSSSTPAPESTSAAATTSSLPTDVVVPSGGERADPESAPIVSTTVLEGCLIDALDASTTHSVVAPTSTPATTSGSSAPLAPPGDVDSLPATVAEP